MLFAHDRATGLVHAIPTPAKGGRYASYLCTELTRFILWTGHPKVAIKCDQEPATLSLMEAVRKACRCMELQPCQNQLRLGTTKETVLLNKQCMESDNKLESLSVFSRGKEVLHLERSFLVVTTPFTRGLYRMRHGATTDTEL